MKSKQIKLQPYRYSEHRKESVIPLTKSLPYFKSNNTNSKYFHRVRYGARHDCLGVHYSIGFWCGGGGFIGKKGQLYAELPEDAVLCATCEGRAIGAGMDKTHTINGRFVKYSPRKEKPLETGEETKGLKGLHK